MNKPEIFAVTWLDFIPLSLHCADAAQAVEKARDIAARAAASKSTIRQIRAVHLPAGSNKLAVLWAA